MAHVGVAVNDGVVTVTGTVSGYARKFAGKAAPDRAPANEERTDTEVAQAVRHALEWDPLVPDDRIHSTVSDGWVTLEGTVELWREREDAESDVWSLPGVRGAYNLIMVEPIALGVGAGAGLLAGWFCTRSCKA